MLSVVIPVYNSERYLRKCLDSVVAQTYKTLEIILVDDGSTDNSGAICDDYAAKYSNIRVFHKLNGGATSAYLFGIKKSTGKYVTFVDSDDWIEPQMYEEMMKRFDADKEIDLVICGYDKVYGNEHQKIDMGITEGEIGRDRIEAFFGAPNKKYVSYGRWNKIFVKDKVEEILPYLNENIRYVEDNLFCLAYTIMCLEKAYYIDATFYHYCFNFDSVSTNINDGKIHDLKSVYKILLELDKDKKYRRHLNSMYIEFVYRTITAILQSGAEKKEKLRLMSALMFDESYDFALNDCEWKCSNIKQKIKKFLLKNKMIHAYFWAYNALL